MGAECGHEVVLFEQPVHGGDGHSAVLPARRVGGDHAHQDTSGEDRCAGHPRQRRDAVRPPGRRRAVQCQHVAAAEQAGPGLVGAGELLAVQPPRRVPLHVGEADRVAVRDRAEGGDARPVVSGGGEEPGRGEARGRGQQCHVDTGLLAPPGTGPRADHLAGRAGHGDPHVRGALHEVGRGEHQPWGEEVAAALAAVAAHDREPPAAGIVHRFSRPASGPRRRPRRGQRSAGGGRWPRRPVSG